MKFLSFFIGLIIFCACLFFNKYHADKQQTITGYVFGTYYVVKISTPKENPQIIKEIDKIFAKINQKLSVFEKNSEINQLNQAKNKIKISPELYNIIKVSQEIHKKTQGYFDPSISPLIELWGFGTNKTHSLPNKNKNKQKLSDTGLLKIKLTNDNKAYKENPAISLNLSAIAKGYAVDMVAAKLKEMGYHNFLIDIGGELSISGKKNNEQKGWNIGIATPQENTIDNAIALDLSNISVATSGNYRNFYYIDGKKYAHTLNPKTGYPVEYHLLSVSVFHPQCMYADAYATAMMAMGEEKALKFANEYKLPAIFIVNTSNDKLEIIYSQEASKMLGTEND